MIKEKRRLRGSKQCKEQMDLRDSTQRGCWMKIKELAGLAQHFVYGGRLTAASDAPGPSLLCSHSMARYFEAVPAQLLVWPRSESDRGHIKRTRFCQVIFQQNQFTDVVYSTLHNSLEIMC